LGRKVGEYIWPEYFTAKQVAERMKDPRASGIEQQEPSPEEGVHFLKENLKGYNANLLPILEREATVYGASDHAVRTNQQNDNSCLGIGMFYQGILHIHPDIKWDKVDSLVQIRAMLNFAKKYQPAKWWAEKENISGALGPVLKQLMLDESNWMSITEVSHKNKDLMARSQSAHAMCQLGLVVFPKFAPWWPRAERELLTFPNGGSTIHDDFVSFLSHICRGIYQMVSPNARKHDEPPLDVNARTGLGITTANIKAQEKYASKTRWQLSHR
jgi:predicted phage terminase large subunit-like protein